MGSTTYTEFLYAAGAAAYVLLIVLLLVSGRANNTRTLLITACAATGASCALIASGRVSVLEPSGAIAELACFAIWCLFVLYLLHQQQPSQAATLRFVNVFGILISTSIFSCAFFVPEASYPTTGSLAALGELYSRISLGIYGLLLVENLFRNTAPEFRWHIKFFCIALGGLFAYSIILYADTLLFRRLSIVLWDGRAICLILAAPLLAVSAARKRDWAIDVHVSRTVVFHTATLVVSGLFLVGLALTGGLVRVIDPGWGDLAEVALVLTGLTALVVLLASGAVRSRLQRFLSENFFTHRYDYRKQWLKSIDILSANRNKAAVQTRVITAIADVADSPGGTLWVRDIDGAAFCWAGSWNCPAFAASVAIESSFISLFRGGEWVVELATSPVKPEWLAEIRNAWLAVPLAHQDQLIGFVVLVRPRASFDLDRETFDLLRIVSRQAAAHVAEQQFAQALAEGRQLYDYGKRFAFLVHDLKNIAGQLSMIVQNSRYNEGNFEFYQDVLHTVHAAHDRMSNLLQKLRLRTGEAIGIEGLIVPIDVEELIVPIDIVNEVVLAIRQSRRVNIGLETDGLTATVAMDPAAFRSVILHLCENAIEASDEVKVRVHHQQMRVQIEVADNGPGMSPEFIRDTLFQPFGSTKEGGFGIGAYQARELIRAAGGDLVVASRYGQGTRMSILLPSTASRLVGHSGIGNLEAAG